VRDRGSQAGALRRPQRLWQEHGAGPALLLAEPHRRTGRVPADEAEWRVSLSFGF